MILYIERVDIINYILKKLLIEIQRLVINVTDFLYCSSRCHGRTPPGIFYSKKMSVPRGTIGFLLSIGEY